MIDRAKDTPEPESEKQTANRKDKPWLWKPGQSGNPKGRPKGKSVLSALYQILSDEEKAKELALAWLTSAVGGSYPHLREIIERQDGKVADQLVHTEVGLDVLIDVPEDEIPQAVLDRGGNGRSNGD